MRQHVRRLTGRQPARPPAPSGLENCSVQATRLRTVLGVAVLALAILVVIVAVGITSREGRLGQSFARVQVTGQAQLPPTVQPRAAAVQATAEPSSLAPLPTIYRVGAVLHRDATWLLTLDDLQILADGDLHVDVTYLNLSASVQTVSCATDNDDNQISVILSSGRPLAPTSAFCDANRGKQFALSSGGTLHSWAEFPPLSDSAQFTLTWYAWGSVGSLSIGTP